MNTGTLVFTIAWCILAGLRLGLGTTQDIIKLKAKDKSPTDNEILWEFITRFIGVAFYHGGIAALLWWAGLWS